MGSAKIRAGSGLASNAVAPDGSPSPPCSSRGRGAERLIVVEQRRGARALGPRLGEARVEGDCLGVVAERAAERRGVAGGERATRRLAAQVSVVSRSAPRGRRGEPRSPVAAEGELPRGGHPAGDVRLYAEDVRDSRIEGPPAAARQAPPGLPIFAGCV